MFVSWRAQGATNSDFLGSLHDRIRDDPVESEHGEECRSAGKCSQQPHHQSKLALRRFHHVLHGRDLGDGLIVVNRQHLAANGVCE